MIATSTQKKEQNQTRNAYWITLVFMISASLTAVASLYLATTQNNVTFYAFAAFYALCAILYARGFQLIQQQATTQGITLVVVVLALGIPPPIIQYQDIGVVLGLLVILSVWQISYLCLPSSRALYLTIYGISIGVLVVLTDLYLLGLRENSQLASSLGYYTAAAYSFGLAILLARSYRFYSLQMKFITAVTILSVAGIGSTMIFVTRTLNRLLTEDLGSELQNLALNESAALGSILESELRSLEVLSQNSTILQQAGLANFSLARNTNDIEQFMEEQDLLWKAASKEGSSDLFIRRRIINSTANELRRFQDNFPEHTGLILTDVYGGLIAATNAPSDFYQANKEWWQEALGDNGQGAIYIGTPTNSEISNTYGIPISLPVYDSDGDLSGVLYAHYSLNALIGRISHPTNDKTSTEIMVIMNGNQAVVTNGENHTLEPLAYLQSDGDFLINQQTYFTEQIEGQDHFVSAAAIRTNIDIAAINQLNWWVVVTRERAEALSAIQSQQRVQIIVGIVIVLVGSLAAGIVGRAVATPILKLAEMSQNVAAGNHQIRAEIDSGDEIAILGQAFNRMAEKIDSNLIDLQKRVDERTYALQASFQITRALSVIIHEDDLLKTVVEQLRKTFDYYHVHVYIYNETTQTLQLRSGSGDIGQQLLAQNHAIPYGQGLIGRALTTNLPVLASDVTTYAEWLPNDLLPNTKSELAVPISSGNQVLGVIDIQEDKVHALTSQDTELIQTIAIQTAIALRNASFYKDAQQRAERETLINLIREKIQSTQDIDTALKTAVRELGQALNSKQTVVRMRTKANGTQRSSVGD